MKALDEAWPEDAFLHQAVAKLPWGHNVWILDNVKNSEERLWYVEQALQNGLSRNVLVLQIESGLCRRQGKATTNFRATPPSPESYLAQQLLKDLYNFAFLTLSSAAHGRDLEGGLLAHLRLFLLEVGVGCAFVGSQVPIEVGGEDFKLDRFFYHLNLRCYVVIEGRAVSANSHYDGRSR